MAAAASRFLPAAFQDRAAGARVDSVRLKYRRGVDGRLKVTCTVEWQQDKDKFFTPDASASGHESAVESTSKASTIKSSNCTCTHPEEDKTLTRRCDGPCERLLNVNQLSLMGQCEHAVCRGCLETAPRIENCFGVLGCPNNNCYLIDEAGLCPDRAKRLAQYRKVYHLPTPSQSSSSLGQSSNSSYSKLQSYLSTSSSVTSFEPVNTRPRTPNGRTFAKAISHPVSVTLAIFRDQKDGTQFLQKQFYEMPSHISVGAALRSCITENRDLADVMTNLAHRCYIGPSNFIKVLDRTTWTPVPIDAVEPLYKLEDDEMRLMLIVDLVGLPTRRRRN
uniref:RING-type domain-containing protein n=1 Tax=Panagrellus redivivus TaxID=6233 RepID=A0A7E4W0J3_PANRE